MWPFNRELQEVQRLSKGFVRQLQFREAFTWEAEVEDFIKQRTTGYSLNVPCGKSMIGDIRLDRNYVNPPYSDKAPWIRKSLIEHIQGKTIVMLLPVDTSSRWFQRWIHPYASQIRFLNQRLIFPPNKHHAAYASMIVVYDHVNYSEKYITWNRKL